LIKRTYSLKEPYSFIKVACKLYIYHIELIFFIYLS
jgi:hypothetical protein